MGCLKSFLSPPKHCLVALGRLGTFGMGRLGKVNSQMSSNCPCSPNTTRGRTYIQAEFVSVTCQLSMLVDCSSLFCPFPRTNGPTQLIDKPTIHSAQTQATLKSLWVLHLLTPFHLLCSPYKPTLAALQCYNAHPPWLPHLFHLLA